MSAPVVPGARTGRAGLALVLAGALGAAGLLAAATPGTLAAAHAPAADVTAVAAGLALVVGWLVVGRLGLTLLAVLVGRLPGAVGRAGSAVAARVTPRVLRGLVGTALGATVVAPAALAGPAASADLVDRLPRLDRLVTTVHGGSPTRAAPALTAPRTTAAASPRPASSVPDRGGHVVVRAGDSLWRIAERTLPPGADAADVAREWPRWYAANRSVIGPDPGLLLPGEQLEPPAGAEPTR